MMLHHFHFNYVLLGDAEVHVNKNSDIYYCTEVDIDNLF
jgi:hypothetical protein